MIEPESFDIEVGARVRKIREIRRLSQTALGEAIGVSFQQVQKYERGANRISCSALKGIAATLGCRMGQLLGEEEAPPSVKDDALARDMRAVLQAHGAL